MKQPLERPMKQPLERPQEWPSFPSRRACIAPCLGRGLRGLRSGANVASCLDVNGELKSNLNLEGGKQQAVTGTNSDESGKGMTFYYINVGCHFTHT